MHRKVLIIGAGRMAEAIVSGLKQQGQDQSFHIIVTNRADQGRLQELAQRYLVETATHWQERVKEADVVLLAAPPSAHDALLRELAPHLEGQLILTVAAGIDPTYMEARLPEGTPVCWMMPNTAAQVQRSMTIYVCGRYIQEQHRVIIQDILQAIGDAEELTEQQVHELTAVTGSAPAFLYLFCEALEKAAQSYGLSEEKARTLVTQMVAGSARMLELGDAPAPLREQVTTPGGSTAAGLHVLHNHDFTSVIQKAVQATNEHAKRQGS